MGKVLEFARDSLRALVGGLGDPARDKAAGTYYQYSVLTDNDLRAAYYSNWLPKKIVDIPALDAVKRGRNWQAEAADITELEKEEKRLQFWGKLRLALQSARLYGGAAIFIGTGDTNLALPLDPTRIKKQGIKYLTVLQRRQLTASEIDMDPASDYFGKPKFYNLQMSNAATAAAGGLPVVGTQIHPSRLVILQGVPMLDPELDNAAYPGWGLSIINAVYDAVRNTDGTASNIASLVFEANVDIFKVPDFMSNLSDPEYRTRIIERFNLAAASKGINKALIMDAEEDYDRKTIAFTQLPEILQNFMQLVSGAADIPMTRLFGMSPAGMNSTGESDMDNYHDNIASIQSNDITPALSVLDEALIRSALGDRPADLFYTWAPLSQKTEKEVAEIGNLYITGAKTIFDMGVFTPEELRASLSNALIELGYYPGLEATLEEGQKDWENLMEENKNAEEEARNAANTNANGGEDDPGAGGGA